MRLGTGYHIMATLRSLTFFLRWNTNEDEVSCLCTTREHNILTGHESRVIIWTVNLDSKESTPTSSIKPPLEGVVNCISQFPHSTMLAISVYQTILIYRYTVVDGKITSLELMNKFHFNEEEINQVAIHPKGSLLCSCDDNGEIKIINTSDGTLVRTLSQYHSAICSSVKFNSKKSGELFSGGLDCSIGRWDFYGGKLLAGISTNDESSTAGSVMVNPPMVHSLDVFQSHHIVVCGLGDGRLVAYSSKYPKEMQMLCQAHAHSASIACVQCIERGSASDDGANFVISAGNDCIISVHRIIVGDSSMQLVGKIDCTKVNWIDVLCRSDSFFIFTADVTGTVSVYNLVY